MGEHENLVEGQAKTGAEMQVRGEEKTGDENPAPPEVDPAKSDSNSGTADASRGISEANRAKPETSQAKPEANQSAEANQTRAEEKHEKKGEEKQTFGEMISETLRTLAMALVIFVIVKGTIAEARYIPSGSMEPTLNINDRILVEKLSGNLFHRKYEHGDILVFFPPAIETGMEDNSLLQAVGGLPFVNGAPVFVKRVIGLPGDRIEVKRGIGVFRNGKLVDESSYVMEAPDYDLKVLDDIGGFTSNRQYIRPYRDNDAPIVVPPGYLFMMGDNRNNSADSHVWGFLDQKRVVGRSCLVFWKQKWIGL